MVQLAATLHRHNVPARFLAAARCHSACGQHRRHGTPTWTLVCKLDLARLSGENPSRTASQPFSVPVPLGVLIGAQFRYSCRMRTVRGRSPAAGSIPAETHWRSTLTTTVGIPHPLSTHSNTTPVQIEYWSATTPVRRFAVGFMSVATPAVAPRVLAALVRMNASHRRAQRRQGRHRRRTSHDISTAANSRPWAAKTSRHGAATWDPLSPQ